MPPQPGYLLQDSATPLRFLVLTYRSTMSAPRCDHCYLSSTASYPSDATGIARRRCTEPSTLPALAWSSGFYPPRCYQRFTGPESSVLPRESATLCPSSLRDLLVESVLCRLRQHLSQYRRASLGKTHHLPISRPASCQIGSPDIRSRLITSARPPLQHHIAGSLFATYTGSASCFLQTHHFWICPCLVGVVLPSGNGGPSCPRLRLEPRPVRHARHTLKIISLPSSPRRGNFTEHGLSELIECSPNHTGERHARSTTAPTGSAVVPLRRIS